MEKIKEATADFSNDYLDGIMYSQNTGVVCTGRLTNDLNKEIRIQRFTRPSDRRFYLHAKKIIKGKTSQVTEAVPIVDYVFRYDRGGFWVAVYAFRYFITPFNRITRWILDKFMHTRVMYHALHQSGFSSRYIIQDVGIPYPKSDEFLQYLDHSFGHYPIWICPLKCEGKATHPTPSLVHKKTFQPMPEMLLNFGIWGPESNNRRKFAEWNRDLEHKVNELGGQKWLYAHAYYTEEEFNEVYDRKTYDALRTKYHATYLLSVYDKVKVDIEAEEQALRASWTIWLAALFWSI
jgi:delta24-sterol reductase